MISSVWRIAAYAVFALLAAGCTSSGDPGETLHPTSTYTPPAYSTAPASPTVATTGPNVRPGEKPPTLPAVGRTNTPAGARAFAAHWMQALDWGYATTDSKLAKTLFTDACHGCARFVRSEFDQQASANRHYRGARLSIRGVVSVANDHHDRASAVADATVSQESGRLVDTDGHLVRRVPPLTNDVSRIWLKWTSHSWAVVDWKGVVHR